MIYGDQLAFFPEQFRMFEYFKMKPETVASYSQREPLGNVRGIFQYVKGGELRRENDVLADTNVPTFWTRKKLIVGEGFIKKDEEIFRIVNPADWMFEGGFYCYILETFVGNGDVQKPHENVNLGYYG